MPVCVRTIFQLDAGTGHSLRDTARAEAAEGTVMKRMTGTAGPAIVTLCVTGCVENGDPPERRGDGNPAASRSGS